MRIITTVLLALINGFAFGQVPNAFQYQSIVRDAANNIISNQNVNLKILILDNSPTGNVLYSETHSVITNEFGLINLQIGGGTILSGSFNSINWGVNNKYVRLEIDPTGGNTFQFLGTSQLLSVPYALHAGSSGNVNNNYSAGNGVSITGNVITNSAPDQTITINGVGSTSVSGTYPNFTISSTDNVNDADSNPTNEIQTISQSGTNVTLSNGGGTFSVNDGDTSLWKLSGNNIYRRYGNIGIGTNLPKYRLHMNDTLNDNKGITFASNSIGGSTTNVIYDNIYSVIKGSNGINRAVEGYSGGISNGSNQGLIGFAKNSTNENFGVIGVGRGLGVNNIGVLGISDSNSTSLSSFNIGLYGHAANNSGYNYGVYSYAPNTNSNSFSGYFEGNVQIIGDLNVTGNISKGGGTFKIDHPLDPYNKYLVHSFVESPEMMNIYSGNITTDKDGMAIVILPTYFQAANKEYKYQLTTIGKFSQAIIKDEIKENSFTIQTSEPNTKVSWQVIGVRADKYAESNRIVPEVEKTHKGTLLHPEVYNEMEQKSEFYKEILNRPTIEPIVTKDKNQKKN
jgi:hypothetical protein